MPITEFFEKFKARHDEYLADNKTAMHNLATRSEAIADTLKTPEFGDTKPRFQS